ncbi:Similar to hypothetical protein SS1G_13760 [Sclerotinia sclerotiorum 1980]; acc. no. XP_001585192 [Pyronema omphalodes CBS 100304]|uniref:Uncharacterized protein n=1 Tax=Pyronema omphalodes (strain CBS 100304) TaxID=1076935 RepID=U4LJQ1_PYROM|nr:Similar to hypothetical protein SS1G_13760 [Sclerotinia sclerotiorum 1980]; acc. no. XP_001585192 [Pyronema omphalodes CBS 100304]
MIIGILTLLYLLHGVESASTDGIWLPPLKNLTALNEEHAPTWVAQPPYRETWGIIYNFTITLGLCVYTAIHINIPAPTDSPMKIWFRKLKWMLIALIAPEIVLYTAWAQFYSARSLCKELNEHVHAHNEKVKEIFGKPFNTSTAVLELAPTDEQPVNTTPNMRPEIEIEKHVNEHNEEHETTSAKRPITFSSAVQSPIEEGIIKRGKGEQPAILTSEVQQETEKKLELDDYDLMMGCDIAMGGFVTGQPDTPAQGDNDRNSYQTLDPYDVTYLVNKGEFLRVEQKQIEDKSKADILAKFLLEVVADDVNRPRLESSRVIH